MTSLVVRSGAPLRGAVPVPGDKSISHRALLLGAVASGESRVRNFLPAADCTATLWAIRALGIQVEEQDATTLIVHGRGLHGLQAPTAPLDCARSGTTMRLLAGLLAGQPFASVLTGSDQLRRRPMNRIAEPLRLMGADVQTTGGCAPLTIHPPHPLHPLNPLTHPLHPLTYSLPVASAQVKSALLLAGLYAGGPTTLHEPGPARDHTERMLRAMGCELDIAGATLRLTPGQALNPLDVTVPGDFSSAAFLIVAATLVPGSEISVEGAGINPTRTGLLDALRAMGADVTIQNRRTHGGEPVADLVVRSAPLRGAEVGGDLVVRAIDEFPILAVAATQARGETLVRDAAELRVKETDRIATTVDELRRLGAAIEPRPDGFIVRGPTPLKGTAVHSHGDHRLAMALAVAGLAACGETTVHDTACVKDSFPGFDAALARLGAEIREADEQ